MGLRAAAIVVVHDTRDDLLACLASLEGAGADEVVVVDSGSSDGSYEAAEAAAPSAVRLRLANVGFGRAANAGAAAVPDADVLVVANADTRFPSGAVRLMADFLERRPEVGIMGPLVRFPDGRLQLSARAFPSIAQAIGHALLGFWRPENRWTRAYRLTDWDHTTERAVDWVSGCCIAVRRAAFDEVDGFDPAYFMFVEDVDLCARMGAAGWKVVFSPVAEVVHAIGGSVSRRRFRMVVEHARSLDRFFGRRYATGWRRVYRLPIRVGLAGWVLVAMGWSLVRRQTHAHA